MKKLILLGTLLSGISFNMDTNNENHEEILDLMKKALFNFCEQHNMWSLRTLCKSMKLSIHSIEKDSIYIAGV